MERGIDLHVEYIPINTSRQAPREGITKAEQHEKADSSHIDHVK
jgi:hypothetical protein